MFPIAQLIKVHLQLWPWLTFRGIWGHFKVAKVKIECGIWTAAPRPRVPMFKKCSPLPLNKNASWPLTLNEVYGSFQGQECQKACNVWTVPPVDRLTVSERKWRLDTGGSEHPVTFDLDWHWMGNFKVTECQTSNRVYGSLNYAKDGSDHSISYLHRVYTMIWMTSCA